MIWTSQTQIPVAQENVLFLRRLFTRCIGDGRTTDDNLVQIPSCSGFFLVVSNQDTNRFQKINCLDVEYVNLSYLNK